MDLLDHGVDPAESDVLLLALLIVLLTTAATVAGYMVWRRMESRRIDDET